MSFYGHEIHVGVDCFSVEPLGLRPGGSLFLPPCELVNQNPQLGFGCSLGDNEGLVTTLHQFDLGGIADVVIDKRAKVSHSCGHVGKRVVIVGAGYPAFILPPGNHLAGFELAIERRFIKEPVHHGLGIPGNRKSRAFGKRNPQGCQACCQYQGFEFSISGADEVQRIC